MFRKIIFICSCPFILLSSLCKAEEKVLVVSAVNGLCNRLRVIASGSVVAEETNRTLLVYWSHPDELGVIGTAKWEDLFEAPTLKQIYELPKQGRFFNARRPSDPADWISIDAEIAYDIKNEKDRANAAHSNSSGAEFAMEIPEKCGTIIFQCIYNIKPKGMSNETFYEKKRVFYKTLIPVPYVRNAVQKVSLKFSSKTVGVHVRTTDLLDLCWNGNNPAFDKYVQAMKKELERDPNTNFFISVDSNSTLKYFKDIFGDKILYYHGVDFQKNNKGAAERGTVKSQKDALIDLFLLSKTSKLIGTKHSSFSYEAACIGGLEMIEINHE